MDDLTSPVLPRRAPLRRAVALLALVCVVGAVACTDGGGEGTGADGAAGGGEGAAPTVGDIRAATAALGSVELVGSARSGDLEGPVSGTVAADPSRGVVRRPVFVGGEVLEAELRWDADWLWVRRVPGEPLGPLDPGAVLVRAPDALPWVALPASGYAPGLLLVPWDPFALLGTLSAATLRPVGEERVGDVAATRYEVESDSALVTGVRLWVDGDDRLVRVEAEQTGVAVTYDLAAAEAPTVTPPPAEEVAEPGSERRPVPSPELAGPFTLVGSGRDAGLEWTLESAPAVDGRTCWRFRSTPEVPQVDELTDDGLFCEAPLPENPAVEARVRFVVDSAGTSPVEVVIAVLPEGVTGAELVSADRSRRALPLERTPGLLVHVGPPDPQPVVVLLELADGTRLGCGPGPVTEPADLDTLDPDTLTILRDIAWGCFPLSD